MSLKTRVLLLALLTMLTGSIIVHAQANETPPSQVVIYLFWGDGCPHCERERAFLDELQAYYPQVVVREYEVWYNEDNRKLLAEFGEAFGYTPGSVPNTFIADRYWVGFGENTARQMVTTIDACLETACPDVGTGIIFGQYVEAAPEPAVASTQDESIITLPLLGEVTLTEQPLWLSTALISFVDGFNPCSLWVLSILLALVIHSGSRKRILLVGLTFLTVAAAAYILFIVGLFGVLSFVGYLVWIQIAVALLAFGFALINIKDYFWYKEGVSLTIPDSRKPRLYRNMRSIMAADKTPLAIMGTTAVMALGVTLLELPCTSGLPVLWTNMIVANDVAPAAFVLLLVLYMVIFLLDEAALFVAAVFTLKVAKFEEKHGRILKLIGGMVMLALAAVMVIDPELMNDLNISLLVFGAALGVTALVLVLHRRVLPHYGVYVGTGMTPNPRPHHRKRRL